jgi:hypothetical protein
MAGFCTPRSTAHSKFRTPLAFRPLSKAGGGGPESGAHLSNSPDQCAQINGDEDHSGPPPPAFLPLGRRGGSGIPSVAFRRPRSWRLDQRRSCGPAPLSCPVLNQCGPSSCHFILSFTFPLLPCVIQSPLLFGPRGSLFFPPSAHRLPLIPFLSTSVSHPKARSFLPSSPHLPGCIPPWIILCHPSLSSLALLATPSMRSRCYHSYHTPCPPR